MSRNALKLRCRDGHFEMAAFDSLQVAGGFWMWVSCSFGGEAAGHWLAPDPLRGKGYVIVQPAPHVWLSRSAAVLARDNWEIQQRQQEG